MAAKYPTGNEAPPFALNFLAPRPITLAYLAFHARALADNALKEDIGLFCQDLKSLDIDNERPHLLNREFSFYYSDGKYFSFSIHNPASIFDSFRFSNKNRKWHEDID